MFILHGWRDRIIVEGTDAEQFTHLSCAGRPLILSNLLPIIDFYGDQYLAVQLTSNSIEDVGQVNSNRTWVKSDDKSVAKLGANRPIEYPESEQSVSEDNDEDDCEQLSAGKGRKRSLNIDLQAQQISALNS